MDILWERVGRVLDELLLQKQQGSPNFIYNLLFQLPSGIQHDVLSEYFALIITLSQYFIKKTQQKAEQQHR